MPHNFIIHMSELNEKTRVPIGWVIALLVGCASFTAAALKIGQYLGGRDAGAAEIEKRVITLETRVDAQAGVESRIDRRLYRLELAQHVTVPQPDRFPAAAR